jgi:hypothetical protein
LNPLQTVSLEMFLHNADSRFRNEIQDRKLSLSLPQWWNSCPSHP